ncbi:hypothetical protein BZG36_04186 [Bifiguratus adelaidae]|uniref:FAD dependent oxidoreductase domain-containing protein n=1 Tax=Bifiguratus adelaidae TaxID=1938954 RepID=A0A261XW34_9FUNG|nr:hypothetical protein BZG36_04186 [Bifiguratus adelaidae]
MSPSASDEQGRHIVIVGGGVIGVCSAYYITRLIPDAKVTLIEGTEIAAAASGKSGGFLALDWCDSGPLGKLARKSFALHAELAAELDGPRHYDYRLLDTWQIEADFEDREVVDGKATGRKGPKRAVKGAEAVPWLDTTRVLQTTVTGNHSSTAQVTPAKFARTVMKAAQANGAKLVIGTVRGLRLENGRVHAVKVISDGRRRDISCTDVVLAMGPWSAQAKEWLPLPNLNMLDTRAHSVVLLPKEPVPAQALFVNMKVGTGYAEPEVYPRSDGTVYLCGEADEVKLPPTAAQVEPADEATQRLVRCAHLLSPTHLGNTKPIREQACFLPTLVDGRPAIGKLGPGASNVVMATGHTCWGILNSPATGLVVAELLAGLEPSVGLSKFDTKRLL